MELNEDSPKGWRGTIRAMLTRHPDRFGTGPGKLNPYALAWAMKKKGHKPGYEDQESSLKGKPKKKKGKKKLKSFTEWCEEKGRLL
jgi:hypothetical protein